MKIQDVFRTPLEVLTLSPETMRAVKRENIDSVGACLSFYIYDQSNRVFTSSRLRVLMYGEVFEQVVAQGYWALIEDAAGWRWLNPSAWQFGRMQLGFWQDEARDFYLDELFDTPLDVLGLSPETIKALKWNRIYSVGDCLIFHAREARDRHFVSSPTRLLMYGEVFQSLVVQGYWACLESAETWQWVLRQWSAGRLPKRVVAWQGEERDLYEVPIEELGLSAVANMHLRNSMQTVGTCIDICYSAMRNRNEYMSMKDLIQYIEPRLKELGYWDYIEDRDSFL